MKKQLLLLLYALTTHGFLTLGQNTLNLTPVQIEGYISEVYGESFVTNNPTLVESFSTLLNHRIEFKQEAQNSEEKYPLLSSYGVLNKNNPMIPAFTGGFDVSTFNPLRYKFDFFSHSTQIIRIDGSDLLMIVHPQI